jgi:ParB/RepB/Spo0J family partition protein
MNSVIDVVAIPTSRIRRDPDNRHWDPTDDGFQELVESIRRYGIRQNLQVIALEDCNYQLVTGERRWAAASKLGHAAVPAVVLSETEAEEAKELQLIENLHREDLDPVDEANGYAWLLAHRPGLTMEEIAQRVGKSKHYISRRLRVKDAPKELLEALKTGRVSVSHVELVAQIPEIEARRQAAKLILKPQYAATPEEVLTVEQTRKLISSDFRWSLADAPFELEKDGIGGEVACLKCPRMSGNAPELAESLSEGAGRGRTAGVAPRLCLSPSCYRAKCQVVWDVVQRQAEEAGQTVWSADMASAHWEGRPVPGAGGQFVDLEDRPGPELTGHHNLKGTPTWGELLGGLVVETAVAQHPRTLRPHTLVALDDAVEAIDRAAEEAGKPSPFVHARGGRREARREAAAKNREERAAIFRDRVGALDALLISIHERGHEGMEALFGAIVQTDEEALRWALEGFGVETKGADLESDGAAVLLRAAGNRMELAFGIWAMAVDGGFRMEGSDAGVYQRAVGLEGGEG